MNKKYRGAVFGGVAVLAAVIITGVLLFGGSKADGAACRQVGSVVTHRVEIKKGQLSPEHTLARRCEKLAIVNQDKTVREMAFGQHSQHVAYDGIEEKQLTQGQSLTVTLDKTGEYIFHDHLHDEVRGSFTVVR